MDAALREKLRRPAGAGFILMGAAFAYWTIYKPVVEAQQTGVLHYYIKGVMLPPMCFYVGAIMLFTNVSDGEIRKLNDKGKPTLTRKGWLFFAGFCVVLAATIFGWWWYLRTIGFNLFS